MADDLLVEQDGPVAIVTFNREDRLNAFTDEIHAALPVTWRRLRDDPSVRAIVITGSGHRAFSTGMDVKANAERGGHRRSGGGDEASVNSIKLTPIQNDVWTPVIVAVNGMCVGGGLHFLCDADVIVASSTASFFDTHAMVGQVGALEFIGLLPRIGMGNALRMVTLGRAGRLSAEDAHRISLVDEVVEPDQLLPRAIELGKEIAKGSPRAIELSKKAIWRALEVPYHDALQHGYDLLREHRSHPDCAEGPRAFAEKRAPDWVVGPPGASV
jgi:E-phenylitaconyl-CoA hydratase